MNIIIVGCGTVGITLAEQLNEEGNNVTDEFIEYVVPLIQGELETPYEHGMPKYARLKRIPAEPVNE